MQSPSTSAGFDVFLSYAPDERDLAESVADALVEANLKVWFREQEVFDYEGIAVGIQSGLSQSKFLLALYSASYPRRRSCQSELTAAYLVGRREGGVGNRLLVVNMERDSSHIHPLELRVEHFGKISGRTTQRMRELAARVKDRVARVTKPLGGGGGLARPPWHGSSAKGYDRFLGRFPEMWKVHDALWQPSRDESVVPPIAVVHGPRGMGKTAFVEEYALRFGPDYPGGIFWLRAYGTEHGETGLGPDEREAERDRQIREIATDLALITTDRNPAAIRQALGDALGRRKQACLWILDDFPRNIDRHGLKSWIGPHELARTIITTRWDEYAHVAASVRIDSLDTAAAHDLLTQRRAPGETKEKQSARTIVRQVGGHPLALGVLAALVDPETGNLSYTDVKQGLSMDSEATRAVAESLGSHLPEGHVQSIANALIRTVSQLSGAAQDFLRLAATLAAAPINASFFASVLSKISEQPMSTDEALEAMHACDARALTEKPGEESHSASVHRLVGQVAHQVDPRPARLQLLRAAAITTLMDHLPERYDPTGYSSLGFEVVHTRELVRRAYTVSDVELLGRLARYDLVRGAYAVAEQLFERRLETSKDLYGNGDPRTANALSHLAGTCIVTGNLDRAAVLHEESLDVRKQNADERNVLLSIGDLAAVRFAQGRLADAQRLQKEALEISFRVEGDQHPQTTTAAWNLFLTLDRMGDETGADTVRRQHLGWLNDAKPGDIATAQRRIRELVAR